MLGFNPIATTPLGDDGVLAAVVYDLTANAIVCGNPTVGTSTVAQVHSLSGSDITTGQPTIQASTLAQVHVIGAQSIITDAPQIQTATCIVNYPLIGISITTGQPVIGQLFINASKSRAVHVSEASTNVAVVTDGPNYSIVSANTPNRVIVTRANEAA